MTQGSFPGWPANCFFCPECDDGVAWLRRAYACTRRCACTGHGACMFSHFLVEFPSTKDHTTSSSPNMPYSWDEAIRQDLYWNNASELETANSTIRASAQWPAPRKPLDGLGQAPGAAALCRQPRGSEAGTGRRADGQTGRR